MLIISNKLWIIEKPLHFMAFSRHSCGWARQREVSGLQGNDIGRHPLLLQPDPRGHHPADHEGGRSGPSTATGARTTTRWLPSGCRLACAMYARVTQPSSSWTCPARPWASPNSWPPTWGSNVSGWFSRPSLIRLTYCMRKKNGNR